MRLELKDCHQRAIRNSEEIKKENDKLRSELKEKDLKELEEENNKLKLKETIDDLKCINEGLSQENEALKSEFTSSNLK